MDRLTYWNNKEKGSALPTAINDNGDTVDLETLCVKLAAYEDMGLEPSEIQTGLELENVFAAMQELKQYKDAEKQGLLVRLPCKAGDTVYTIEKQRNQTGSHDTFIERNKVIAFQFEGAPYPFMQITGKTRGRFIRIDAIGKLVFLTREAAESALAEMTDTANDWRE